MKGKHREEGTRGPRSIWIQWIESKSPCVRPFKVGHGQQIPIHGLSSAGPEFHPRISIKLQLEYSLMSFKMGHEKNERFHYHAVETAD